MHRKKDFIVITTYSTFSSENFKDLLRKFNDDIILIADEMHNIVTESNINAAKVYMKGLVGSDNNQILKNMHDFKKVFKKTNLLYGKDNTDYFIIAIDSDDLNTLSDTLEEQGYLRDEILDKIMP